MAGGVQTAGPSAAAAPERGGGELHHRGTGEGSGYDSTGWWTPVWTPEYPTTIAAALRGSPASGHAVATPVAKADAEAAWPDGNEAVRSMVTWRVIGTWCVALWGRCRRPNGLSSRLATAEVTAMGGHAVDCGAAAAYSVDGRQDCGSGEP
jgi:hypothetical protein